MVQRKLAFLIKEAFWVEIKMLLAAMYPDCDVGSVWIWCYDDGAFIDWHPDHLVSTSGDPGVRVTVAKTATY